METWKIILYGATAIYWAFKGYERFIKEKPSKSVKTSSASREIKQKIERRPDDFKRLVKACFGDRNKALRLMKYEKTKNGFMSDEEACIRAFERLEQDRK